MSDALLSISTFVPGLHFSIIFSPIEKNKVVLDDVKTQISVILLVKKQLLKLKGAYLNKNKEADIYT